MNIEQRFNYYIKNWKNKQTIKVPDHAKEFKLNELIYYTGPNTPAPKNFKHNYGDWNDVFWWKQGSLSIDIPCLAISSDGINNHDLPALVNNRYLKEPYGGILCPMGWGYLWGNTFNSYFRNNVRNVIKWKDKINEVIWRGCASGPQNDKNWRIKFCDLYMDKYNVGITNTWDRWDPKYVKGSMSKLEMLKYKYQISMEGNAGTSDLQWKLQSNSVVLMKKPRIETWLMEGLLEPYVHYIPLKDDYSDLEHIISWCKDNDDKCLEIVKNANIFMKQFEDKNEQQIIFNMIKQHYKNSFTLE